MTDSKAVLEVGGQYNLNSVKAALASAGNSEEAVLKLGTGVFNEKLYSRCRSLQIIGAGRSSTIITNSDGAYHNYLSGEKIGTFRSFTACFQGERLYMEGLTIENACGNGSVAGQGIALYLDSRFAYLKDMSIKGHQDTLFLAPIPESPRIPGSFKGPGLLKKRLPSLTYLENCYIEGDVDFIFGGGEAIFENCTIHSLDRREEINGYITAPSTAAGKRGFTFYRCLLTGDASEESVYLGRPWRPHGNAVFLDCKIGRHVAKEGWTIWNPNEGEEQTVRFGTYPLLSEKEPHWSMRLTEEAMLEYTGYMNRTREFLYRYCTGV